MYPGLPCADIDEAVAFYEALGFRRTYRQVRPNPYAVVERDDMAVHLFGMDGFNPADSYATVIITIPDPDELHRSFTDGLRAAFGKVPVAGIPRMVRPRKRWGTVYGFSVVDAGGNWLRFSKAGAEEGPTDEAPSLARQLDVAARLADSHGDDPGGLATLERAIAKYPDAPAVDRARAHLYRADLLVRVGRVADAVRAIASAQAIDLDAGDSAAIAAELAHVEALVAEQG
jgi:catechol 2,3-dioxygenase-like lactoylglutathione lyase family enzyme